LVTYLSGIAKTIGMPADELTALNTSLSVFDSTMKVVEDPATNTPIAVGAKNDARKAFEGKTRVTLKAYVTYNPKVTDDDRRKMELPIHKKGRTPSKAPRVVPAFRIESGKGSELIVHFHSEGGEGGGRLAKPEGIHGAEIIYGLFETPPESREEFPRSVFDTRSPYIITFDLRDAGKTCYFSLRWENNVGAKGPWSEIKSAIVPK
jgi:hypothetical protein